MKDTRRLITVPLFACLAAVLTACGAARPTTILPAGQGEAVPEDVAPAVLAPAPAPATAGALLDDPTPLPEPTDPDRTEARLRTCQELRAGLAKAVGLDPSDLELRPADVLNAAWGNVLDGCRLSWAGPGVSLAFGATASDMPASKAQRALLRAGWEEDAEQVQDMPGGFVRGFVQGNKLCLLALRFEPPAGRTCPAEDPVTCGLGPAELDYDLSLSCADY